MKVVSKFRSSRDLERIFRLETISELLFGFDEALVMVVAVVLLIVLPALLATLLFNCSLDEYCCCCCGVSGGPRLKFEEKNGKFDSTMMATNKIDGFMIVLHQPWMHFNGGDLGIMHRNTHFVKF